jgi:hypothetical protein
LKYERVVEWSSEGDTIRLEMLGEDQQTHRLEVGSACAGVLVAALAAEMAKLDVESKDQQLIRPTKMQTGSTYEGEPMIILGLQGGMELPLVFKPESLGVLIAELEKLRGTVQSGSQVRWT